MTDHWLHYGKTPDSTTCAECGCPITPTSVLRTGATVISGTTFVAFQDTRKFSCPVHGIVTRDGSLSAETRTPNYTVIFPDGTKRMHCLLCYTEWLEKNIPQLTEVK